MNSNTCSCVGPQNGAPRCPCIMRQVIKRNGRYILPEQDLGPVPDDTGPSYDWYRIVEIMKRHDIR